MILRQTLQPCKRCLTSTLRHRIQALASVRRSYSAAVSERQWSTPLAKQLSEAITITGPIPLSSYMRQCLTSPDGGYYTTSFGAVDQFGAKGDFVTSPEISQIFGELVGVWITAEWMMQGWKKKGVALVELGPGRGTLMADVLRTIRNFSPLQNALEEVHMVEASPFLREAQHRLLCGDNKLEWDESLSVFRSRSKLSDKPISWHESLHSVPRDKHDVPFVIAHEFFDALPINAFQSVKSQLELPGGRKPSPQWRELLVSPTSKFATHQSLKTPRSQQGGPVPEFQLSLAPAATPYSLLLPNASERYTTVLNISDSTIEISPETLTCTTWIASLIGGAKGRPASGGALILDYGPGASVPTNSLRGIKSHKHISPFHAPGSVDLSADVDFGAIVETALSTSDNVEVHGPVEQSYFLLSMGIEQRAKALKEKGADAALIDSAWKRLVDRSSFGMGSIYKALAIVPSRDGKRPIGFGGDLTKSDMMEESKTAT